MGAGELPKKQFGESIQRSIFSACFYVPRYLSSIHSNCEQIKTRQLLLENLNEEEKGKENHPELWMRFAEGMGNSRNDVNETIP